MCDPDSNDNDRTGTSLEAFMTEITLSLDRRPCSGPPLPSLLFAMDLSIAFRRGPFPAIRNDMTPMLLETRRRPGVQRYCSSLQSHVGAKKSIKGGDLD